MNKTVLSSLNFTITVTIGPSSLAATSSARASQSFIRLKFLIEIRLKIFQIKTPLIKMKTPEAKAMLHCQCRGQIYHVYMSTLE